MGGELEREDVDPRQELVRALDDAIAACKAAGFDLIWFGIFIVLLVEIAELKRILAQKEKRP